MTLVSYENNGNKTDTVQRESTKYSTMNAGEEKQKRYVANYEAIFLTVIVSVFPPRPLPLSPLRHHGAGLCVIVQTIPTARCFPTSDRDSAQKPELVFKKTQL